MSSQKKKTPAEELLDSILDEVGSADETKGFAHFSHDGLAEEDDEEPAEAQGAKTEIAHTIDSDEDDIQIEGLVSQEKTVVADMNFGGLLRKNPNAQERTQVYQPDAKTQVHVQNTQIQNDLKTQVVPMDAKTRVMPDAKTQVVPMDAKTHVLPQAQTEVQTEVLKELNINPNYITEDLETAMQSSIEEVPEGEIEVEGTHPGEGEEGDLENTQNTLGALELDMDQAPAVSLQALENLPGEPPPESDNHQAAVVASSLQDPAPKSSQPTKLSERPSLFEAAPANDKTQLMTSQEAVQNFEPELPSPNLMDSQIKTVALNRTQAVDHGFFNPSSESEQPQPKSQGRSSRPGDASERTVAVTGFQIKPDENLEDKVKVSVGKQSRSSGFSSWGSGVESNLSQAENLRMAQEKILELENENEKLRRQNEELIAASEILRERSDLMTSQLTEFKNDRESLEQSFKSEMTLMKNHVARKDAELKRALIKVDELESRLKFDLKKIRVRERELENRLELVRAEKNAISKNKDEQILDLRRKMDVIQMEVDSYRQKCVELNKQIESSQDSFKRTTRALRLAMANLELQEENKAVAQPLKKAE